MRNFKMKKVMMLVISFLCFVFLISATNSFAFGLGSKHCWVGNKSGVFIELQVTQLGAYYNLNGAVTLPGGQANPAYGTAFYDIKTNKIKIGYTIARISLNDFITALLDVDPFTLNGIKVVVPYDGGNIQAESISSVSCQ